MLANLDYSWPADLPTADELNDLYFRAAFNHRADPHFAFDDRPIELDRHAFRLQLERANHVEQSRFRRERPAFAVEGNLIFR